MNKTIWSVKKGCYRSYQFIMKYILRVLKYRKQKIIVGEEGMLRIPYILKENNIQNIFLVCSKSVRKRGLLNEMLKELEKEKVAYTIFEDIKPNPSIENVEEGYSLYMKNNCKGIVVIGGGSPMDCAKIIGVKVNNPKLSYKEMKSIIAIKNPIPLMIAVPTTAGTGSESTVAAVITDSKNHSKYAIMSMYLMPEYVVLDEKLTIGLPKDTTAYTGMDALTHAIEAYIGKAGTKYTNEEALKAIKLIFENLEEVYNNGTNIIGRRNMLIASNYAANAFTRAFIGYVHSISHALSAIYDVGHGKTNAIVLPYVLKYYGKTIEKKLAEIAIYTGIGNNNESREKLSKRVIDKIEEMNKNMNIPDNIQELKKEDINIIVEKALKEGNPNYPVPKIMNFNEGVEIVEKLLL